MEQKTIVFKVSDKIKAEMIDYFEFKRKDKTPPYAIFQATEADTTVTLYESGKVMFQGISADIDAAMWKERERFINNDHNQENSNDVFFNIDAIGSDEVGTGDFFGPVVVTASFVKKSDFDWLEKLGVKDSKKLVDYKIKQIVPKLIAKIPYASVIMSNKEYNYLNSHGTNMNAIKAILHNKALLKLQSKLEDKYEAIIMDQFTPEKNYYKYLKGTENICKGITFVTKGEDKSLAVAVSSLISRYLFLKEIDKLSAEVGTTLPKGAGAIVDNAGKKILDRFGPDKFYEIAKLNFKNIDKIKNNSK